MLKSLGVVGQEGIAKGTILVPIPAGWCCDCLNSRLRYYLPVPFSHVVLALTVVAVERYVTKGATELRPLGFMARYRLQMTTDLVMVIKRVRAYEGEVTDSAVELLGSFDGISCLLDRPISLS